MPHNFGKPETSIDDFFGVFEMKVDDTQRVAIPSKLLEALRNTFPNHADSLRVLLTYDEVRKPGGAGPERIPYLQLFPAPVFQHYINKLSEKQINIKVFTRNCDALEFEKDRKRVRLVARLVDHLGIDVKDTQSRSNEVVFQGNRDTILVYSLPNYLRLPEMDEGENQQVQAVLGMGDYFTER